MWHQEPDFSHDFYGFLAKKVVSLYAWMIRHKVYAFDSCPWLSVGVMAGNIILAYLLLRFFDFPVRKWLNRKTAKK